MRSGFGAAVAAIACVCALAAGTAESAPSLCTTIGVTNAAARKAFGSTVVATDQPNPGEDLGICLVSHRGESYLGPYGPGAMVELYSLTMGVGLLPQYEHGATSKKPLTALGKGAVLVTGPPVSSVTLGGPDVYFSTPTYFVTIVGLTAYKKAPGATAAQVVTLAREIHAKLG